MNGERKEGEEGSLRGGYIWKAECETLQVAEWQTTVTSAVKRSSDRVVWCRGLVACREIRK